MNIHGFNWLLEYREGHLTLIAVGPSGETISTQIVPDSKSYSELDDLFTPITMPSLHCRGDRVYVGVDKTMRVFRNGKPAEVIEFAQQITSLVGSTPTTRARIAATFAYGGTIYWDDFGDRRSETFASHMQDPVVGFNRGGLLIATSHGNCEVYNTRQRQVQFEAKTKTVAKPIAVLAAASPSQFGIVSATGEIAVYELA